MKPKITLSLLALLFPLINFAAPSFDNIQNIGNTIGDRITSDAKTHVKEKATQGIDSLGKDKTKADESNVDKTADSPNKPAEENKNNTEDAGKKTDEAPTQINKDVDKIGTSVKNNEESETTATEKPTKKSSSKKNKYVNKTKDTIQSTVKDVINGL